MTALKTFDEYLEEGAAKKQSPDKLRAKSLIEESKDSYETILSSVEKMGLNDNNANYIIKNAYDVIMELVRAKMLSDGFGTSGIGAHEVEVSYMSKMGLEDKDINFANDLRYFRNRILYYGKKFGKEYAQKVLDFMKRMYVVLAKMNEQK